MTMNFPKRRKNTLVALNSGTEWPPEAESFEVAEATFIRYCKIRNLSGTTLTYYHDMFRILVRLMTEQDVEQPRLVTADHIHEAFITKREEGVKDVTIDKYYRGWRAIFNFLATEGYIPENPFDDVVHAKSEDRIIETFSKPQVRALLNTQDLRTFTGLRNYTMMITMLELGVRISELVSIQITGIYWSERKIKVYGKGRKERLLPFQSTLEKALKDYIKHRGILDHDFLFVNIDNTPIKVRTVQEIISDAGIAADIKGVRCSPHTWRHTFAKMYIMDGGDPLSLQVMLGHTTLEMCKKYVRMFSNDIAIKHARHSPLEKLYTDD